MLSEVHIQGFRRFKDYRLQGLKRVNLIVGKNGVGKTSLLEAVCLLKSQADFDTLRIACVRRGELSASGIPIGQNFHFMPDVRHLFFAPQFGVGDSFRLDSDDAGLVEAEILGENAVSAELRAATVPFQRDPDGVLRLVWKRDKQTKTETLVALSKGLALIKGSTVHVPALSGNDSSLMAAPVYFMPPSGSAHLADVLAAGWEDALGGGHRDLVVKAMQTVDPRVKGIEQLSVPRAAGQATRPNFVVEIEGRGRPLPIGTIGEGASRAFGLALALILSRSGALLVDEIGEGVHYSALAGLWKLILSACIDLDVQVFATTHSDDCVHALGRLCMEFPEFADEISIQRIDGNLDHSLPFSGESIERIFVNRMEVR